MCRQDETFIQMRSNIPNYFSHAKMAASGWQSVQGQPCFLPKVSSNHLQLTRDAMCSKNVSSFYLHLKTNEVISIIVILARFHTIVLLVLLCLVK